MVNGSLRELPSRRSVAVNVSTMDNQERQMTQPTTPNRPKDRATENENLRPDADGQPPRPATEPAGSEGSSNSGETATDPATGEEN